ncbi:MAG: S9 family peptidase [Rhizobacter sp.]|nr:S9 family peptidase [Bacteriovorax sp.]
MEDKYLWLEEVLDEKSLVWARKQNARTFEALTKNPEFEAMAEGLTTILESKERIAYANFIDDGFVYNTWNDEKNVQGLIRRTPVASFISPNPVWEILIDLDVLSTSEGEKWVSHGMDISPDKKRALIFLSPGGSDADTMREFDFASKSFVADGFKLPMSKGSASWLSNDEIFLERDFGPDTLTESGYPRTIRRLKRGQNLAEAKIIFETPASDTLLYVNTYHQKGASNTYIHRRMDFYSGEIHRFNGSSFDKIEMPHKFEVSGHNLKYLFMGLRQDWKEFFSGDFVAYNFETNKMELIFHPDNKSSVYSSHITLDGVMLIVDTDVRGNLYSFSRSGSGWIKTKVNLPVNGSLDSMTTSNDTNEYLVSYDAFDTPVSYYYGSSNKEPVVIKISPSFFEYKKLEVSQHFAKSLDGTMVPYFLVHKLGLKLDGKNPTILYGYGGFEISLKSHFSNLLGYAWLDKGGVYVLSNIRGGGEYGPAWHQCALKENRDRAYQDFFAIAEELIAKKITSRDHLGAWGGSNGGLLMGVCYTQRPDLFKAINCGVPLLDMHRYHKLLAGHSWVAEYGNPDDEVEGIYIRALSPYQRINKDEKNYPVMYINTSTKDDRVHPGHARKFAAKLEEYGLPYFYHENIEGGHAGASNMKELAFMKALDYSFFWKYLK